MGNLFIILEGKWVFICSLLNLATGMAQLKFFLVTFCYNTIFLMKSFLLESCNSEMFLTNKLTDMSVVRRGRVSRARHSRRRRPPQLQRRRRRLRALRLQCTSEYTSYVFKQNYLNYYSQKSRYTKTKLLQLYSTTN